MTFSLAGSGVVKGGKGKCQMILMIFIQTSMKIVSDNILCLYLLIYNSAVLFYV